MPAIVQLAVYGLAAGPARGDVGKDDGDPGDIEHVTS